MPRLRRRLMHYSVFALYDGTVLTARPVRKPIKRILKREGRRIDADGVVREYQEAGQELSDVQNETRTRFQDIIAASLNNRRNIRSMVLPCIAELQDQVRELREQLDRIEHLLVGERAADPADGALEDRS